MCVHLRTHYDGRMNEWIVSDGKNQTKKTNKNELLLLHVFVNKTISVPYYYIYIYIYITGMSELVKERPPNPVEWLASYLLANDPQKKAGTTVAAGRG